MPMYQPEVILSSTEKEILRLLAHLISQSTSPNKNLPPDGFVLTNSEAERLLELLEEFSTSRKFLESAFFVENLSKGAKRPDDQLREIYLSWRKRHGRSRALASAHWREFLNRLGLERYRGGYLAGTTEIRAEEMHYRYFREMERLLLSQPGVSSRVRNLVLSVIDRYQADVEAARRGEIPLPDGSVSKLPLKIMDAIRYDRSAKVQSGHISAAKIAGLMTIVTDTSVLFTTRDWGVAGTMSTMAGALAAASAS